jgi:hypothetical protein
MPKYDVRTRKKYFLWDYEKKGGRNWYTYNYTSKINNPFMHTIFHNRHLFEIQSVTFVTLCGSIIRYYCAGL